MSLRINAEDYQFGITSLTGYDSHTPAAVTVATDEQAIPLTLTKASVAEPADPALSTVTIKCIGESGAAEAGIVVSARIVKVPANEKGQGYSGVKQAATSNGSGIATLTLVRLATYQYRREDSKQWEEALILDVGSQTLPSLIGPGDSGG